MEAILVNDDKSLSWTNVPDLIIKSDEVLVEIHAAALNRADLMQREGYAEFVAVKYDMLMPVPKNCSMAEASAIPEAFATAYLNLF